MNLDDLRNNSGTVIDATQGKIEPKPFKPTPVHTDPVISTNDGYTGGASRTPTTENLPEPRQIKEVNAGGAILDENYKPFDINSLPKKQEEPSELETTLMGNLEKAVDAEIESIDQRMEAIKDMQYKEFLEENERKVAANNASIDAVNAEFGSTDYEPETEVQYDSDNMVELRGRGAYSKYDEDEANAVIASMDTEEVETDDPISDQMINGAINSINYDASEEEKDMAELNKEISYETSPVVEAEETQEQEPERETVTATTEEIIPEVESGVTEEEFFAKTTSLEEDLQSSEAETTGNAPAIDEEKMLDELRSSVRANITPLKKKIDLSKFSIAKTPMSASKAVSFSMEDVNRADWVLSHARIAQSFSGLSGSEIFSMDPTNSNRSKINTFKDIYSIIYRHILNTDKGTFEQWMKSTRFSDIQDIYFGLYRATFYGSNFVNYECPECHHVFIKDYPFDSMVKYKDDETKAELDRILQGHITTKNPYPITRYQVSDNYVFDIREPSVWNTVIEMASLSDDFLEKYEDLINTIIGIDKIYVIDYENQTLVPIDPEAVSGNVVKTVANKIKVYSKIIRDKIPSDNFFDLRTKIAEKFNNNDDMSYIVPECNCPRCNKKIEERAIDASDLLFTRHQLGALVAI